MRLLLFGFVLLALISCDKYQKAERVDFEITNNTDQSIEFVYLSTIHNEAKTTEFKIAPNSNVNTFMDFSKVAKSDGSYSIYLKYADSLETVRNDFGYYTNGYPLDLKFSINIYNDSLRINSTPRNLGSY